MASGALEILAADLTKDYPVLTALAAHDRRDREGRSTPLARLFAWLIFELHIRGRYAHSQKELSGILRGLSRGGQQSALLGSLGSARTPRDLQQSMLRLGAGKPEDASLTGHDSFDTLWRTELCAAVDSLTSPGAPNFEYESGEESLATPVTASGDPDDDDALDDAPFFLVPSIPEGETIPHPRSQLALALALAFERRSTADILRHPDNLAPPVVTQAAWRGAHEHAQRSLERGDHAAARRQLALLLAIEAGVSEAEIPRLNIGLPVSAQWLQLDLAGRRLLRGEVRPRQAFSPTAEDAPKWMETGSDITFPLTDETLRLADRLLESRSDPAEKRCPFVLLPGDRPDGKSILRTALRESSPNSNYSPTIFRKRIASHLHGVLGLDVAQMAFGDSFGMNPTGTYYCRIAVSTIASCLASELARVTSGSVAATVEWTSLTGYIGSRVAPAGSPIADLALRIRPIAPRRRGRPNLANCISEWRLRRDRLAIHLALATGHRPNDSLSLVVLDNFALRHALVVLRDKRSDPAHFTRFASTGWAFVHELRDYLGFLEMLIRNSGVSQVRHIARTILRGGAPLFRIVDETSNPIDLNVPALFAALPAPWNEKRNLHRHALCQLLVQAGIDPELRFAQMGWLLAAGGGSSECAPYSPVEFTAEIAPLIDDCLRKMGWLVPSDAGPIQIELPARPLTAWEPRIKCHQDECVAQVHRLRVALFERRASALPIIQGRLAGALTIHAPGFELVVSGGRPWIRAMDRNATLDGRAPFSEAVVRFLLDKVAPAGGPAIESMVAAREVARLLREGIANRECRGFIPAVPRLSPVQEPSPFLLSGGLAIGHTDLIRDQLEKLAIKVASDDVSMLGHLAWLAVLSSTPYRSIDRAKEIVVGSKDAIHAEAEGWVMRVPTRSGAACLTGLPFVLLDKLRREHSDADLESVLTREGFSRWFSRMFPGMVAEGANETGALQLLEQTLQVAARFELTGIERALLLGDLKAASVSAVRAASVTDGRTVPDPSLSPSPEASDYSDDPHPETTPAPRTSPSHRPREKPQSLLLLPLFSIDFKGEIDGVPALPAKRRRAQLIHAVVDRRKRIGAELTTDLLLLDYFLHLLGEERGTKGKCRPGTIHTKAHRFAKRLLELGLGSWDEMSIEQITTAFHAVLLQSPTKMRARVLGEIRQFHSISGRRYDIESPDWALLCKAAGQRWVGRDAGILGKHEIRRVARVLEDALVPEGERLFVPLRESRLRELHRVARALLEASGCRPRSIYGLSLADLHFDDEGDFIHLQARGRFESQKTPTAAGFIPLEGDLWNSDREWLRGWHERRCEGRDPSLLPKIPLFEEPGTEPGTRFAMREIFGRIGQLLRWSTSIGNARTYWLRKHRLQERHRRIQRLRNPTSRDVVHALRVSGHMSIHTPLASYLHDAMGYMERGMRVGADVGRPALAAITGLKLGTLAQRARRCSASNGGHGGGDELRIALTLPAPTWMEATEFDPGTAPVVATRTSGDLSTIATAMSGLSLGWDEVTTARRCGIAPEAVVRVRAGMDLLTRWTTYRFGLQEGELAQPRSTSTNQALLDLLRNPPAQLSAVAVHWGQLAIRVPISAGCPLIDKKLEVDLEEILAGVSLGSERIEIEGVGVIRPAHPRESYGLWPALRWVLAVAWVADHVPPR
ncbi:hypothetical protein N787_11115 [Arenimonas metalli CF5-1]|uniref:Uncharacterized protein n=2 Tax=Arenimonas TaxID=490567 RepID=A0A091BPI9_9GAMM|nr:hypothetical protein N787_11115 [Arenimonas metalli CF5-1]